MRQRIYVKQSSIDKGVRNSALSCPVAIEIFERTGLLVLVCPEFHLHFKGKLIWRQMCPQAVDRFTLAFDAGLEVAPFSFHLEIPDDVVEKYKQGVIDHENS